MNSLTDNSIASQGRLADAKLAASKLTLTQGGEPTFVPQDTSSPEWNVTALGPDKLVCARQLARHLASTLFKGGVVLQSFGKQYPGEPLPRWQVGIYRSLEGKPLWTDLDRLRLDQQASRPVRPGAPQVFLEQLSKALGLRSTIAPAYEDLEAKLKATGSQAAQQLLPRFSRRKHAFVSRTLPAAMSRKWRSFFQPVGWVLPVDHDGRRWRTGRWRIAGVDELTLIPGDSPIGLRLPLNRLPHAAIHCGLTVEIKNGELLVFLPPVSSFAAFVELVRIIERLTAELKLPPIRLEGYRPPADNDLESIALTSDPGVLEVNLPPADNWPDLERIIRGLFTSAEATGLRGFKYQLTGRRVSTGGGAHILLGGPDLQRNPFIRQPTLLSSFLRFLQNHPSLSYVFSGLFTGPSCQAPRVDESTVELRYELEITLRALEEMPQPGDPVMIDAMLRNLLMDWNGNTHRAELSVDKFHNLDASNGRSGLIEFRAFEMVPTADMLLATHALLRALAACFSEQPYTRPLIDWGEALHDRFALPWFLRQDLRKVVRHVNKQGFCFQDSWFDAHLDFRFPVLARFQTRDVTWTLRQALEPWPVMGDHRGTGRIVDASTDRLEVLARGLTKESRLAISVNGVRLPLVRAARGIAVGAVRYRLSDNPWGLQPHVKAHTPLRFAVIDAATGRVSHLMDYHSGNPLVGTAESLPKTEQEARQRVAQRIVMRPAERRGKHRMWELPVSPRAPLTLDLRRS